MPRPLAALLFLVLSLPAQAAPWWGQTTSNLKVRQGDKVVATLAKGQTVYVLYPEGEEWLAIEYDLNPNTTHRVAAAYVTPFTMPERVKPRVGERGFRIFFGSTWMEPKEVTVGGQTYPIWTAFDYVKEGDTYRIIGPDGTPSDVTADTMPTSYWMTVPWDWANNVPVPFDERGKPGRRYYHGLTRLLGHDWFYWTAFLILFVYIALFAIGIGVPKAALWGFALLIPLSIGACQGNGLIELHEQAEIAGGFFEGARSADGHISPFPRYWIMHGKGDGLSCGDWLWFPLFMITHVILLLLSPWAFRGAHFLLVPHPAEKHLETALATGQIDATAVAASVGRGDMDNPPPQWVSQNQKRRLDALRERFQAETGLLTSAIEWKRKKAELED